MFLFATINLFSGGILTTALLAGAAFMGAKYLTKGDTAVEERRRKAVQISEWMQANGLGAFSPIMQDYAVGDYSGLVQRIRQVAEKIHDPAAVQGVVDTFLSKQLDIRLADAAKRDDLLREIARRISKAGGVTLDAAALQKLLDQTKTDFSAAVQQAQQQAAAKAAEQPQGGAA